MKTGAIVLAAGRGTRLQAKEKNKVVYTLGDKPMVSHTVSNLKRSGIEDVVAVVGYKAESVQSALGDSVSYAFQENPIGTADAAKKGLEMLGDCDEVIIVSGDDSALYPPSLYNNLSRKRQEEDADIAVLTLKVDDPEGLGRVIRAEDGQVERIVEEKNASQEEKKINEVNSSMYCIRKTFLEENIGKIEKNEVSGEYYLTDIIEVAKNAGRKVVALSIKDQGVWQGVNDEEDYKKALEKYEMIEKRT